MGLLLMRLSPYLISHLRLREIIREAIQINEESDLGLSHEVILAQKEE